LFGLRSLDRLESIVATAASMGSVSFPAGQFMYGRLPISCVPSVLGHTSQTLRCIMRRWNVHFLIPPFIPENNFHVYIEMFAPALPASIPSQ
jgi:hypothetical protein